MSLNTCKKGKFDFITERNIYLKLSYLQINSVKPQENDEAGVSTDDTVISNALKFVI